MAMTFCVSQSDKVKCYTKEVDMLVMGPLKPIEVLWVAMTFVLV